MTTYDSSNFFLSNKDLNILREYSWELINDLAKQVIDVFQVNKAATTYDTLYGEVSNQADYGYHKWTDVPCFLRVLPPDLAREKYGIDHQHALEMFFDRDYVEQLGSDNAFKDELKIREGDYLEYEGTTFEVWRSRYIERVGGLENVPKTVQVDAISVRTRVFDPSSADIGSYPKVIRCMGSSLDKWSVLQPPDSRYYVQAAAELHDIMLCTAYGFLRRVIDVSNLGSIGDETHYDLQAKAIPYFTAWATSSYGYDLEEDEVESSHHRLQRYPYVVGDPPIGISYDGGDATNAYAYVVDEQRFHDLLLDISTFLTTYNPAGVFLDDHTNAHNWWVYINDSWTTEDNPCHVLTAEEYDTWQAWLEEEVSALMTGTQKLYVNGPKVSNNIRVRRNWEGPGRSYNQIPEVMNNMKDGDLLQGNIERNDNWCLLTLLGNLRGNPVCLGQDDATAYTVGQGWDTDIGFDFSGRINIFLPAEIDEYYSYRPHFDRFGYPDPYFE